MLKKGLRAVLVSLVLVALSIAFAARSVWAVAEDRALSASRVMMNLPAAWLHGSPRRVVLNGAAFELLSGRADYTLHALLDHAEAACRQRAGDLAGEVARALARPALDEPTVLRLQNEREGLVACLDLGPTKLSAEDLHARLSRFSQELDLAELGGVRLLRAEALAHGSFFVLVGSDGSVPLLRMFPDAGDAPGIDPAHAPRPANARRVLSAYESHASQSVVAYESSVGHDVAFHDYLVALEAVGFRATQAELPQGGTAHVGLFQRAGESLVVLSEADEEGSRLVISSL